MDEIQAEYEKETGDLYHREDRGPAEDKRWYERFTEWITYTKIPTLRSALQSAREEIKVYRNRMITYCAYCGEQYKEAGIEQIQAHVKVCPKHPYAEIKRERDTLKAEAARMREAINKIDTKMREVSGKQLEYWSGLNTAYQLIDAALTTPAAPEKAETVIEKQEEKEKYYKESGTPKYVFTQDGRKLDIPDGYEVASLDFIPVGIVCINKKSSWYGWMMIPHPVTHEWISHKQLSDKEMESFCGKPIAEGGEG